MTKRGGAVWPEIVGRIQRAARNGERLHLDPRLVRAIFASELWLIICHAEQQEVVEGWDAPASEVPPLPPDAQRSAIEYLQKAVREADERRRAEVRRRRGLLRE